MAWSFQDIKYGWKIATGAILVGATIFVADNIRQRIYQRDMVEIALGVTERALATQMGTNTAGEPVYSVTPPSFVRSWYSNSYESTVTNGVTNWTAQLHTNVFTNVIGWRTDRSMMVSLDNTIKALCPFYVDANSVYDGTTNIVMLTFTGLLTSLNLGDHTNFTSIPAIGTNAATFGPWAWRNYVVAWQERYKVLNALKMTKPSIPSIFHKTGKASSQPGGTWIDAQSNSLSAYNAASIGVISQPLTIHDVFSRGVKQTGNPYYARLQRVFGPIGIIINTNDFSFLASLYLQGALIPANTNYIRIFDNYGDGISTNYEIQQTSTINAQFILGDTNVPPPISPWCDEPQNDGPPIFRGYTVARYDITIDWQFNYCTVKYWE